jgi:5'-deoxynucleotidase
VRPVNHFFAYLYRLRFIQRWSLMRNAVPESVAEHSFQVAILAHALCTISEKVFHKQPPTERAVTLALFHDAEEVITGDIPTPVKHHNAELLRSLRQVEALASERLLGMVPEPLSATYRPLLSGKERDPDLLAWVKAADKLDAYLKCAMELAVGNREFAMAQRQLEQTLQELGMPEVDYFLEHFAPSFEKTLDELTE